MIIAVTNVTKQFSDLLAVNNISFSVKKGEVVGFVGANGAGKTTTINLLLGFTTASEGEVQILGETVTPAKAHLQHRRIGYASGDMELPQNLTAKQYLGLLQSQNRRKNSKTRLAALTEKFQPVLDKPMHQLSRGNKQKIALIVALLPEPDLIILDEPTSGLDPIMQEVFLGCIREEAQKGTTIFMSSHYLNEVADVCSRVILMRGGKIVSDRPAKELFASSGKTVSVVTGYARTTTPRGAVAIKKTKLPDGLLRLSFEWRSDPAKLQQWVAGVKQLQDIEITEYNLDAAFKGMYDGEHVE